MVTQDIQEYFIIAESGFIKKLPAIKLDIIFLFLFLKEEALEQPELNVTASHVVSFSLYML